MTQNISFAYGPRKKSQMNWKSVAREKKPVARDGPRNIGRTCTSKKDTEWSVLIVSHGEYSLRSGAVTKATVFAVTMNVTVLLGTFFVEDQPQNEFLNRKCAFHSSPIFDEFSIRHFSHEPSQKKTHSSFNWFFDRIMCSRESVNCVLAYLQRISVDFFGKRSKCFVLRFFRSAPKVQAANQAFIMDYWQSQFEFSTTFSNRWSSEWGLLLRYRRWRNDRNVCQRCREFAVTRISI